MRILLLHLGLLILVVFFVLGAARQVQVSARGEVQNQSMQRLQLLADQTARGLESQYVSILSDLDVILRDESAGTTSAPAPAGTPASQAAATAPLRGRGLAGGVRGGALGGRGAGRGILNRVDFLSRPLVVDSQQLALLWRQLRGRVSQIFLVNLNTQAVALAYPDTSRASAMALARQNIDWIKSIKDAQMSGFKPGEGVTEGSGYHLIAVPAAEVNLGGVGVPGGGFGGRGGAGDPGVPPPGGPGAESPPPGAPPAPQFAVVVVVPIETAREKFLTPLNSDKDSEVNAILVNDAGEVLVSNSLLPPGSNLLEQLPASVRPDFADLLSTDEARSIPTIIEQPFSAGGGKTIPPQIVASAQVAIAAPRHWTVLVSSPLADAETVVNTLFRKALAWAVFVSLSVTGILVSTSVFMIRARIGYERARHDMLTRELEQARHIQLAWLPDLKSVPPGIEVSAANLPASHISGDFYNWFALPSLMQKTGVGGEHPETTSGKAAIVIGDVTGHGMAAAFLMATTQLLVRMTLSRYQDAGRCLREVNRQLCMQAGGFKGQFVTMLVIVLDTQHNTLQAASAGHPTPLIEAGGTFRSLELEPQLVLGVNPDEDYHAKSCRLEPAAAVVLYTDGVVEAENPAGAQYGVENLLRVLQAQQNGESNDPSERIGAILSDVKRFCGSRELHDDVTLVALRTSAAAVPTNA